MDTVFLLTDQKLNMGGRDGSSRDEREEGGRSEGGSRRDEREEWGGGDPLLPDWKRE